MVEEEKAARWWSRLDTRKTLFSLMDKNYGVSSMFGSLKYTLPKSAMTAQQKLHIDLMHVDLCMRMYSLARSLATP
jgi:hypothetical protein